MKLGFLKQIFQETEEELQEQIDDAEKSIKKAQKQLKKHKKGFLGLFQASKDDLKEQIEESKRLIEDAKKRLKEAKTRNKKYDRQRKAAEKSTSTFLKKHWGKLLVAIIILLALWYALGSYKAYQESYKYECVEKNPCTDCKAVISCVDFDYRGEDNQMDVWFTVENRNDVPGECVVSMNTISDTTKSIDHPVGIIAPNSERVFKIRAEVPFGTSDSTFAIDCDWQ